MRSHSVTCHPAEVTFQHLPQPKLVLESSDDEANAGTGDRTDRGTTSDTTIIVDQWVVVGYPGKRKNTQLMYVGQVTKVQRR